MHPVSQKELVVIALGYKQPYPDTPFFRARGLARKPHRGIDFCPLEGHLNDQLFIVAPIQGKIVFAGWHNQYGFMVAMLGEDSSSEYLHFVGHMAKIRAGIKPGMILKKGEILGLMGSTGTSTAKHLHYQTEIRLAEGPQSHWWTPGSWLIINPTPFCT